MSRRRGQQMLDLTERVSERSDADRVLRRAKQPLHRLGRPLASEPVLGDRLRVGTRLGEALRGITVQTQASVARQLVSKRLTNQLVPKPVAGAGHDQHSRVQRGVEQRERILLRHARQTQHACQVELVTHDRERRQRIDRPRLQARKPTQHGLTHRPGQHTGGARRHRACELEREERASLRQLDDPRDRLVGRRHPSCEPDQLGDRLLPERAKLDRQCAVAAGELANPVGQARSNPLRPARQRDEYRTCAARNEQMQRVRGRLVKQVRVLDAQHRRSAHGRQLKRPLHRRHNLVASQRTLERRRRSCERRKRSHDRPATSRQSLERRAPVGGQLLKNLAERSVRLSSAT